MPREETPQAQRILFLVGIRDGNSVDNGKGGNPSMRDGVDPDLIVGNSTLELPNPKNKKSPLHLPGASSSPTPPNGGYSPQWIAAAPFPQRRLPEKQSLLTILIEGKIETKGHVAIND